MTVTGRGYRVVAPVRITQAASSNTFDAPRSKNNLPSLKTRLVGRSEALTSLGSKLASSRVVTIVGTGGVGKTTIALAVAERQLGKFTDGAWFVDLATVEFPERVFEAIANALGMVSNSANVLATLTSGLRERRMLIVLDNCEHVVDAIATLARRVAGSAPYVSILAKSREPLQVSDECVFRLSSLEFPANTKNLTARRASEYSAIQLFTERASDRMDTFQLRDDNATHVAEICKRLDGLALAIELAATRIDAFKAGELLDLLDDRFQLLKGPRGAHPRHQTVLATLDWSYQLLDEDERTVMRRLSVFSGSFSLAAAHAIVGGDFDRTQVRDYMGSLVAKSLISAETPNGVQKYRQLETTKKFAANRLEAANEIELARSRHARYFLEAAEFAVSGFSDSSISDWIARHRDDLSDLRSALAWCFKNPRNFPLGIRLTMASLVYWESFSMVEECRVAVERALQDEYRSYRTERDELILRLTLGATLLHTRGPLPEIRGIWNGALELAERSNENAFLTECLSNLSEYAIWTGDTVSALRLAKRLKQFPSDENQNAQMFADGQAGNALRYTGNLGGARLHLENMINRTIAPREMFDIPRFGVDQRLNARGSLALVMWMQGYPDQAWQAARLQRDDAEVSNHPVSYSSALIHTSAPLALYMGDFRFADELLKLIDVMASEHELTVWRAMATCLRAKWLLDHGSQEGLPLFRDALDELYRGGFRMRYPVYLGAYGQGLAEHGDIDAAHATIDESIRLSLESGQTWSICELLRAKGHAFRAEGTFRADKLAAEKYMESIEWARRQGGLSWELRSATSLAELEERAGMGGEGKIILSRAYDSIVGGDWTQDKQAAYAVLGKIAS